jgi:hypothetical protein
MRPAIPLHIATHTPQGHSISAVSAWTELDIIARATLTICCCCWCGRSTGIGELRLEGGESGSGVAHMRSDSAVAALHAAVLSAGGGGVLRAGRGVAVLRWECARGRHALAA